MRPKMERTTRKKGRGRSAGQSPGLPFRNTEFLSPPYNHAVIYSVAAPPSDELCSYYVGHALKLAIEVELLIVHETDDVTVTRHPLLLAAIAEIERYIAMHNFGSRARITVLDSIFDTQTYFQSSNAPELVITKRRHFEQFDEWNRQRKKAGLEGYDILCMAMEVHAQRLALGEPLRAYRLASVGGTFNAMHKGHTRYLTDALRIADEIHVLIANDHYATERKDYIPYSFGERWAELRKFVLELGCSNRVVMEELREVANIKKYVREDQELDLVITEDIYFDWFDEWNRLRRQDYLTSYDILCRERMMIRGEDVTSSKLAKTAYTSTEQGRLFDSIDNWT